MIKKLVLVAFLSLLFQLSAQAERVKCQDSMSPTDVIAVDTDSNGNQIEYHRNAEDIAKVIESLKSKIASDPSILTSPEWKDRMLTSVYWEKERCGGTKNCSSKECPSGKSCVYGNVGMAGCRCE